MIECGLREVRIVDGPSRGEVVHLDPRELRFPMMPAINSAAWHVSMWPWYLVRPAPPQYDELWVAVLDEWPRAQVRCCVCGELALEDRVYFGPQGFKACDICCWGAATWRLAERKAA